MKSDLSTRTYLWLASHRRLVLAVTLLITLVSLAISSRIQLEEDVLAILPQHDPIVDDYQYSLHKFRQIDRIYFDVGIATADPDKLGVATDELFARLTTNAAYGRIMYRIELQGQDKVIGFLTGALPNLFTEADAKALEPKLESTNITGYLTVMRRKLAGMDGMVLKDVVAADPVGLSGLVVAKVVPLQAGFGDAHLDEGRITSSDGRHVLMMAEPKLPSSDSGASTILVNELLRETHEIESHFPGLHIAITGGHRMSVDNATQIKTDTQRCIFLGMGAMLVLCLTAYRRRWLALLTFLPSFFGTLMAGVVIALWYRHLSAIALGFATIAIGITVDYAIYVIYHLDNAAGLDQEGVGRHMGRLVAPISIGALTTMAAFVVMATSSMHGYQQLGVYGAMGVLFSALFSLVILPLLVPIPKQKGQPPLWLTRLMEKFYQWRARRIGWLIVAVVVLSIVTAFGVKRLRFEGDIAKLNGITESTRQDDALIRATWGDALGMTMVVVRGATPDLALAENDRAAAALAQDPNVTAVYTLASVCPSRAVQESNIQRWRLFWTAERQDRLRQNLQKIGGDLGFRSDAFAIFWERLKNDPALITLDTFHGTPLEQALTERVALGTNDNAISTMIKLKDRAQAAHLRQVLPGMILLDQNSFAEHIAALAKEGMGHFALWTVILVTIVLLCTLGSIELTLATLLPLAFGLLWTFGFMGWLGLPIDMMNSVFVIFIIGVGEDYCVFLVTSKLDEWRGRPQRLAATSASVVISALTTLFGFAVLVIAKHPVLFSLGTTVLLGMVCSFAATLILTLLFMDLLLFHPAPRGGPRWWHLLGTLWAVVHVGLSELFLYGILRPWLKIFSPRTADATLRRTTSRMARAVVQHMPFGRLEFQNITAATFARPSIVISNHQSAVDVMLMVSLPGDVRQTAKKRIFDSPLLGIGCRLLGHVMVEPNNPSITLQRCREKLAEGASVHFYPEGTRSPDGFLQRFHLGAFELAVNSRQDILPIVLCDAHTAMPRDAYWFEPYHVTVRALPRVTPENFDYTLGSMALMRHCEAIVRAGLQQQLDEINTPRVLRRKVNRLYRYQGFYLERYVRRKLQNDLVFPLLDSVVPRRGLVLDLGCGLGLTTHWLAETTDQRTFLAVDDDEEKIRIAQCTALRHRRIKFEKHDVLTWEYPPCDTVLLLDGFHEWPQEKQQLILEKARRALRSGGCLVVRNSASRSLEELTAVFSRAGFANWRVTPSGSSNASVLLVAVVG